MAVARFGGKKEYPILTAMLCETLSELLVFLVLANSWVFHVIGRPVSRQVFGLKVGCPLWPFDSRPATHVGVHIMTWQFMRKSKGYWWPSGGKKVVKYGA